MKNISIICLLIIAIAMKYMGISAGILPPTLTGVGFIVIAPLFFDRTF